jgi:hypothetical protein
MTTHEILTRGREAISDPAHWIQNSLYNYNRTSFCSYAAVQVGAGDEPDWSYDNPALSDAYRVLAGEMGDICGFNNTHTHDEVLAAWDRAIASTEPVVV